MFPERMSQKKCPKKTVPKSVPKIVQTGVPKDVLIRCEKVSQKETSGWKWCQLLHACRYICYIYFMGIQYYWTLFIFIFSIRSTYMLHLPRNLRMKKLFRYMVCSVNHIWSRESNPANAYLHEIEKAIKPQCSSVQLPVLNFYFNSSWHYMWNFL